MEQSLFNIGKKVICIVDYHSDEDIRLRAKNNMFYVPKKNQPLTVNKIIHWEGSAYLQFEEIINPLVEGKPVGFYQFNFAPAESLEKSIEFSEEIIHGLTDKINKGIYANICKNHYAGKYKVSHVMPFLMMIAQKYNLNLSRNKGYRVAGDIFKKSLKLN